MNNSTKEATGNIKLDTAAKIQGLEKDLIPIKELLESILNKYNIREGVTLKVTNSNVMAIIDVEQLRKD